MAVAQLTDRKLPPLSKQVRLYFSPKRASSINSVIGLQLIFISLQGGHSQEWEVIMSKQTNTCYSFAFSLKENWHCSLFLFCFSAYLFNYLFKSSSAGKCNFSGPKTVLLSGISINICLLSLSISLTQANDCFLIILAIITVFMYLQKQSLVNDILHWKWIAVHFSNNGQLSIVILGREQEEKFLEIFCYKISKHCFFLSKLWLLIWLIIKYLKFCGTLDCVSVS